MTPTMLVVKLKIYVFKRKLRHLIKLQTMLQNIQYHHILIYVSHSYKHHDINFIRGISDLIMSLLCPGSIKGTNGALYNEYQAFVDNAVNIIKNNEAHANRQRNFQTLVKYYFPSEFCNIDVPTFKEFQEIYQSIPEQASHTEIATIESLIKTEEKDIRRKWANIKKTMQSIYNASLIDLKSWNLTFWGSLYSLIFLTASIIYYNIYYFYFGIIALDYFGISDYIGGFLLKAVHFTLIIAFLIYVFPEDVPGYSGLNATQRAPTSSNTPLITQVIAGIYILGTLSKLGLTYIAGNNQLNFIDLHLSLAILLNFFISRFSQIFKQDISFLLRIATSILLVSSQSAVSDARHVRDANSNTSDLSFIFQSEILTDDWVFLGTNGRFFFFFDKKTSESFVIPSSQVRKIIKRKVNNPLWNL